MRFFRSKMSMNFRVDDNGETAFFFPVIGPGWCPYKGARITSDEDVEKLKKYVAVHAWALIIVLVPLVAVLGVRVLELNTAFRFAAFLLSCMIFAVVFVLIFEWLFIRGIVEKYGRTEDPPRFAELQRRQAESSSWGSLLGTCLLWLFFLAASLLLVLTGFAVQVGIVLFFFATLVSAPTAHQIALKRQMDKAPDPE